MSRTIYFDWNDLNNNNDFVEPVDSKEKFLNNPFLKNRNWCFNRIFMVRFSLVTDQKGKVLEFQRSWMRHKLLRAPQSRINKGMSLDDFKFIYWMEYGHRMWGRALGIMFALPFSYFLRKGYITPRLGLKLSGLFALGAGQGLIGWWMVKSGLEVTSKAQISVLFLLQWCMIVVRHTTLKSLFIKDEK
ncbi:hypothetical protein ACS0TY_013907 [Phlomoides rotata]